MRRPQHVDSYVIAHGDLDGLTSAATILNVLTNKGKTVRVMLAHPHSLAEVVYRVPPIDTELLVIVDVAVDEATWAAVKGRVRSLKDYGVKVMWVDHHPSTFEVREELKSLGVEVLVELTPAVAPIVREKFLRHTTKPQFFNELLMIGEAGDRAIVLRDSRLANIFETLSLAIEFDALDEEFKLKLVKMWAYSQKFLDDEVTMRAERAAEIFARICERSKERVVYSSDEIIVVDMVGVKLRGFSGRLAAQIAEETGKVCFLLLRAGYEELVVTCRVPPNVDFNANKAIREIARKFEGSGGGHKKAAAARVLMIYRKDIINYIREKYGKSK